MSQTKQEFYKQLKFGKIGESYIATWLRRIQGYHVLPVYEKEIDSGKGPVLFQSNGRALVAPDMLAFKNLPLRGDKDTRWTEAKTKSAFSWHRQTRKWVTGIDLRHYEDYLEVADISPWPVWLLFLHFDGQAKDSPVGCPTGLFGGTLTYLCKKENHRSTNWGKSGMVYWAHNNLKLVASLEEVINASR